MNLKFRNAFAPFRLRFQGPGGKVREMFRRIFLIASLLAVTYPAAILAAESPTNNTSEPSAAAGKDAGKEPGKDKAKEAKEPKDGEEKTVRSTNTVSINGESLTYIATAGTILLRDDEGKSNASIFYIAYTLETTNGLAARPLTFSFNGG